MKSIKLLILDNDGVLTDGKITYDNNRIESKNYAACDGLGIKLLSFTDIKLAIITGRESEILKQRCDDLNITLLYQKVRNKKKVVQKILDELGLSWENVAAMGDDWNDYPMLKMAKLSASPQNAFDDLKSKVDYVTTRNGGEGAVREFIELILKEQGIYDSVVQEMLESMENS